MELQEARSQVLPPRDGHAALPRDQVVGRCPQVPSGLGLGGGGGEVLGRRLVGPAGGEDVSGRRQSAFDVSLGRGIALRG